ncbi:cell death-inducing p53-target protein 1-like [Hippocampus comes]|uniref:cell death-inducing p53-target protein 1-like n=1 Tax=Hippocampus comes TaxID=109280 RepID=UPI00094E2287|nr:PREDICTED: cell death-inducing p53-target protein 1-like [Hippocampus comes]
MAHPRTKARIQASFRHIYLETGPCQCKCPRQLKLASIYPPPPPGHFPHPIGPVGPGPFVHMGGCTATTVMALPGSATTVTVLQGEMLQTSPVQTACPHCQQAIVTRISHDVGLMNTLFCLFCFFVGCDLGCCLIDDLKDVTHTCPYYTYKRIC